MNFRQDGPRATVDCERCGVRIIDVHIPDWAAHMSPPEFIENMRVLMDAHDETCKVYRTPLDRPARARRRWWWLSELLVPVAWTGLAAINLWKWDEPLAALAWFTGALLLTVGTYAKLNTFRAGYHRGRAETLYERIDPTFTATRDPDLHPADGSRIHKHTSTSSDSPDATAD